MIDMDQEVSSQLIAPHGGTLVNRCVDSIPNVNSLPSLQLDDSKLRDVEQIAIGTYSPIEGFMGSADFLSVLNKMRLTSGVPWPLPIILDVPAEESAKLPIGQDVALRDEQGALAVLHLAEKYTFDKPYMMEKLYGTHNVEHPGVRTIQAMNPVLLGGKISMFRRRQSDTSKWELTPVEVRKMFDERGWSKVVGFHTRNVIHRSHEFIQLEAMKRVQGDGLFVHPVVGKKKQGDYHAKHIIKSYETMMNFYPKDKVVFSVFSTYSRYAGPREAIFTALCRKNFGCSHFVVGRDHTGVGSFYPPTASHDIFKQFPDLGIEPVLFGHVFYSKRAGFHIHDLDATNHPEDDKLHISGTEARKIFERGESPPEWFMRPEIAQVIRDAIINGEEVFVR